MTICALMYVRPFIVSQTKTRRLMCVPIRHVLDDEEWIDASRTCDTDPGNLANEHEGNKFALSAKVYVVFYIYLKLLSKH